MTFVKSKIKSTFNASGVSLINSSYVVNDTPMATKTNLQNSLNAVGRKMSENDVLFLFFTAHGGRSHYLSAWFEPFELKNLNGDAIKRMLDSAKIKRRVIVISACYSGGFIPPLQSTDTLIMTAARRDRTSFGCQDDIDMTFFGRAYFKNALSETRDLVKAFDIAKEDIANREKTDDYKPSHPQIWIGEDMQIFLSSPASPF